MISIGLLVKSVKVVLGLQVGSLDGDRGRTDIAREERHIHYEKKGTLIPCTRQAS